MIWQGVYLLKNVNDIYRNKLDKIGLMYEFDFILFVVIFVFYEIYICMFFDIDYIFVFKLIGV